LRLCFERLRKGSSDCLQLKQIEGRFYVHRVTSERAAATGKVVKISEHMGTITQDGLFIEKSARRIGESRREVYEYANAALAHSLAELR
jgi:hypothetical protein